MRLCFVCVWGGVQIELRSGSGQAATGAGQPPRALCHLCGLATASAASLPFHLEACRRAWAAAQRGLPPGLRRRRPRPPSLPPPTGPGPLLEAWNQEAAATFTLESQPR